MCERAPSRVIHRPGVAVLLGAPPAFVPLCLSQRPVAVSLLIPVMLRQ